MDINGEDLHNMDINDRGRGRICIIIDINDRGRGRICMWTLMIGAGEDLHNMDSNDRGRGGGSACGH